MFIFLNYFSYNFYLLLIKLIMSEYPLDIELKEYAEF